MKQRVRKAVFPVAGLGTRILPATKAMPKEMLTVVDRPLIHYAIEEAKAAGIEQFYFVTGRAKSAIEDHFDLAFELDLFVFAQPLFLDSARLPYCLDGQRLKISKRHCSSCSLPLLRHQK